MVVRKRKKKHKLRGHRTFGAGDTKNRRGGGTRGGRGRGGSKKHKFTKYWKTFGMKKTLKPKNKQPTFNIAELEAKLPQWEAEKKIAKEKGVFGIDGVQLGIGKVLGGGKLSVKLAVKNVKVSKKAKERIEAAGGTVQVEQAEEAGSTTE